MSIIKTKKVSVYVPRKRISRAIDLLTECELMETADGERSAAESAVKGIDAELERLETAIAAVGGGSGGFFRRRKRAPRLDAEADKRLRETAAENSAEILDLRRRADENAARLEATELRIRQLEPFLRFDAESFSYETENTKACTVLGKNVDMDELSEKFRGLPIYCEEISRIKKEAMLFFIYLKRDRAEVEEALEAEGLHAPELVLCGRSPREELSACEKLKAELSEERKMLSAELAELSKNVRGMELFYDKLLIKREKYSALLSAGNTERVFILSGYVPEKSVSRLEQMLAEMDCVLEEETPEENEILPTAFSNNALVAPVEEVTASYSMPSSEDIDPNPIMAIFYYWFFGMMFSDAGYGLLLMAVCGILGFSKIIEKHKRGMYRMFFWCGVSTTLWGIAYGSFFGDLIGTASKLFGKGETAFEPVLIDPVNQALELLIIAVGFGLMHILTALALRLVSLWRKGDRVGAVCDAGSWIAVLTGAALFAVGVTADAEAVRIAGLILAACGVIILVALGGRDKNTVVMRIFSGILSLYDITSFLGDILSYSRLMALGLATGVIASVVNVLASLGGNSAAGAVTFVAVSVFGHAMNFAINMLGAYVHTNRLQYVEFYQKFYEGGGRRFKPLSLKTKYYDFTEE